VDKKRPLTLEESAALSVEFEPVFQNDLSLLCTPIIKEPKKASRVNGIITWSTEYVWIIVALPIGRFPDERP
jgi:hypothetical protein